MKKVKRRSYSILGLVLAAFVLMTVFFFRLAADGEAWATFPTNQNVFRNGHLAIGTVYDRNEVPLATAGAQGIVFNQDAAIRRANFHVVGDRRGNIGTGALAALSGDIVGYNLITGVYSLGGQGNTIRLTIDAELNRVAYQALDGRRGAVVVMNYQTGEILVSVSTPAYDPANPPQITPGDPAFEGVYLNRVLSAAFVPGSIFKVITAAAAMDTFDDAMTRTYTCNGYVIVAGNRVTCLGNHGTINMTQAMGVSCNPFFAQLALDLGGPTLRHYADRFGLLSAHNLDGIQTAPSSFTAAEGGSAALAWSGVGQSDNLVNPFSMVRFMGAIARDGAPVEPRLLAGSSLIPIPGGPRPRTGAAILPANVANELRDMLRETGVNFYQGAFPGLPVAGKTGTAEVDGQRPHAWFAGFLDDPDNPLAFVVIVENGGFGLSAAGGVANRVLQAAVG